MNEIVIDARELNTSSGRYVEKLLDYLQRIDNINSYSVLIKPSDAEGWQPINPKFKKVLTSHKEFTFSEQLGLLRLINSLGGDLVHFTFPQQPILYRGTTITTIHDLTTLRFYNPDKNAVVFKVKQQIFKWVMKRAARKSRKIIVSSNFVKDDICKTLNVNPGKVNVIYEAAKKIAETPEPIPELTGKNFIMYIGRPTPHKNLKRFIEAFKLLKVQHPNLYLVLAGKKDANYRKIKQLVEKNGIEKIMFTGFVSESRLRWLYENTSAYVFPSLSEGFGLPGLEAMAHGAPVVSSNSTCLPEIYGDAAYYFDPLDVQEMADAINEVLTDKALRIKLINHGKIQILKYSWQKTAEQTLALYSQVLNDS